MININTNGYKRITKRTAKKLFNEGKVIFILPCKARLNSIWFSPYRITNTGIEKDFDKIINSFEYYNCNSQLGRYTSFYIEEN